MGSVGSVSSGEDHGFSFTERDQEDVYTPPAVGANPDWEVDADYDLDGLLTDVVRPDGLDTRITHDSAGRVDLVEFDDDSDTFPIDIDYAYTSAGTGGRIDTIDRDGEEIDYTYSGSLVSNIALSGTVNRDLSITYEADDLRVASTQLDGESAISYAYDDDDLLTDAGGVSLSRDADTGRVDSLSVDSAVGTSLVWEDFAELSGLTSSATSEFLDVGITRDKLGREVEAVESVNEGAADTFKYAYDPIGQLTAVRDDADDLLWEYAYDDNGNRTSVTDHTGGGTPVTTTWVYDEQDRLADSGGFEYEHSEAGDLLAITDTGPSPDDVTSFTYDASSALLSVDLPDGTLVEYTLDGVGRRIARSEDSTLTDRYIWSSDDRLIAWEYLDGATWKTAEFVYASSGQTPDQLIKDGVSYAIISDQRGSVRAVVNTSTEAVVQQVEYDPWGVVLAESGDDFQPLGYAGGLTDSATDFVRFGAREYLPALGRWSTKDPIGFAGGDVGLYNYVGGDPVNRVDPTGTVVVAIPIAIGGMTALEAVGIGVGVGVVTNAAINAFSGDGPDRQSPSNSGAQQGAAELGPPAPAGGSAGSQAAEGAAGAEQHMGDVGIEVVQPEVPGDHGSGQAQAGAGRVGVVVPRPSSVDDASRGSRLLAIVESLERRMECDE